ADAIVAFRSSAAMAATSFPDSGKLLNNLAPGPPSSIIVFGADHNAEWQSEQLKAALSCLGEVVDAADSEPKLDNYVDISSRVCNLTLVHNGTGVIICG